MTTPPHTTEPPTLLNLRDATTLHQLERAL